MVHKQVLCKNKVSKHIKDSLECIWGFYFFLKVQKIKLHVKVSCCCLPLQIPNPAEIVSMWRNTYMGQRI